MTMPANAAYRDQDLALWHAYKASHAPADRAALLARFEPVLQAQVAKWAGALPRSVLANEARLLAAKAFDSYDPARGAALATHVTNALLPLSRVVYTYQNTARLPENVTLKLRSFNAAQERLTYQYGREPTTDELHQELGWPMPELTRLRDYQRRDLLESGGPVADAFYSVAEDQDEDALAAVYLDLAPDEKRLFEWVTGYGGAKKLAAREILARTGWTQAQLSYKKTLLTRKVAALEKRIRP